ncbi:MAG: hypothetical protein GY941_17920 [Planctomycetes bacterium]|nr:hypothetical protein [Planctomycetota bacterium]
MKFNINEYVKVKLTKIGLDEMERQHALLKKEFPKMKEFKRPEVDDNGYSRFQLHVLMSRFGHMCTLGSQPPFEMEIIIYDKHPNTKQ